MERGQYSPPNGAYPQELPDYWRFDDGTIRTDLPLLTNSQLAELGWIGPIEFPEYDYLTHERIWNESTRSFDIVERPEPLPEPPEPTQPPRPINYKLFWDNLLSSTIYTSLKEAASANLELNTICTEFLILLADAKFGEPNQTAIQNSINQIFTTSVFTEEELIEVQSLFKLTGLGQVYTLS